MRRARGARPSSRWSPAWRAASAPASAASSRRSAGYVRLCVDGPVLDAARAGGASHAHVELCGIPLAHPIVNASGTFDAIAARRAFGDALLERFPFAAFVTKTVTLEPRAGQPAAAAVGARRRDDQLDRAAQQGPRAASSPTTCRRSPSCPCR